ncbi:MAG: hypothetical protein EA397_10365 [Deltaproteobacteria bacterium]|nr:MAG: hypothetical protein EA397_10365 [Deltaproteobacteria bacterium]
MAAEDLDPYGNYYFTLEIDGVEIAHFLEFSGLKTKSEVFEVQEGGFNGATHKLVGGSSFDNITLKYATSASTQLAAWRDRYMLDEFDTRPEDSGAIIVRDNAGQEIRRYTFHQLWPVSWEGPSLDSGSSGLAVETLELAFDELYFDNAGPPEAPEPEPPFEPEPNVPLATADVPFEFDSDQMKEPEGSEACDKLHESVKEQDPPPEKIWIDAHTCTMGSYAYNLSLSEKRAQATAREMKKRAEADGLNTVYVAAGFSYQFPIASNLNAAGRASNRRSEFFTSPWEDRGRDLKKDRKDPGSKPKGP